MFNQISSHCEGNTISTLKHREWAICTATSEAYKKTLSYYESDALCLAPN